ncbi:hypothetical protein MIND_00171200 [Mycena indigotica]|uniref:F-box domain-containing protein n=1 Tax=Mycena indigotica TaxID=2126181 RepID=A0A8H6TCY0_9AGAR|nr:uncharacterized protein MIND_00171200 [Mycena indigotica]KAF7316520.1 hypothetical protein MIND_00171200 [Mycena indigotica]
MSAHSTAISMDSPFAHHLDTNYCPSEAEISIIENLLVEPTQQIETIDKEIAALNAQIAALQHKSAPIASFVTAHRALISPIRQLPDDVLQEIFVACLPANSNCVMSASEAPLLLGRICSAWRDLAFSTPVLWSRLHCYAPGSVRTDPFGAEIPAIATKIERHLDAYKAWLARTGNRPLSVSVYHGQEQWSCATTSPFLDVLVSLAARWEFIQVSASERMLTVFSNLTRDQVPLLKSLELQEVSGPTFVGGEETHWGSCDILSGPKFCQLSASVAVFRSLSTPKHWNSLHKLVVASKARLGMSLDNSLSADHVLALLRQCPNLQYGRFQLDRSPDARDTSVFEHNSLRTLIFETQYDNSQFETLSRRVLLPQLRHLRCSGKIESSRAAKAARIFFAAAKRLDSIDVNVDFFTRSSLEDFLRQITPSFTTLSLRGPQHQFDWRESAHVFDDALLQALVDPKQPLVPNLECLSLDYSADISDKALLAFVRAKMNDEDALRLRPLRRLSVSFRRLVEDDILPDLQGFITERGLHVSLAYQQPEHFNFSPWEGLDKEDEREQLFLTPPLEPFYE